MRSRHSGQNSGEAGNAMLYVLIGIALFVALVFTFTKSSRFSKISTEDAILQAQAITSYADKINGAVQSAMLQSGCLSSQISFENSTVAGYTNAGAPANKKCNIFDLAGGGMNYEAPPAAAIDTVAATAAGFPVSYLFSGNVCVDNIGTGPLATCASDGLGNEELLLIVPFVNATVCAAINKVLENKTPMLQDSGGSFDGTKFTGTFADGFALGDGGFTTYPTGCFQSTGGGSPGNGYHFYTVLLAR